MSNETENTKYKLTEYSHGAGCGCKIAPQVLDEILKTEGVKETFPNLLVGNQERDDAAVFDLGDGTAVVSTTDFFMPIVDDAHDFGRIASVNAISDIYAMGATPLVAIAILGWPIDKLPAEVANQVIEGARAACAAAGIALAGGHSIDSPEPIFGLAVTGKVAIENLKRNGGATESCQLFLTKGLGVGILSTAQKKKILLPEHATMGRDSMVKLNKIGEVFAKMPAVKAMTDVTGFGLMGHLTEMCAASNLTAVIDFSKVPYLDREVIDYYIGKGSMPGGTKRNFASYGHKLAPLTDYQRSILCDPQTSGGLLVAVESAGIEGFLETSRELEFELESIGKFERQGEHLVRVV